MKKMVLRYGLIAGLILSILMTVSMLLMQRESINFKQGELFGYITMILALSFVFVGVYNYRKQQGPLSFGTAFSVGLMITLVASILYVGTWMILSNTVASDFGDLYYDYFIEQLKESGKNQDEIDKAVAGFERNKALYKNPLFQAGITFLEVFPIGLIVSLIAALILKKRK